MEPSTRACERRGRRAKPMLAAWASPRTQIQRRYSVSPRARGRGIDHLRSLCDLAGLQAARADVHAPRRPAIVDADLLQVRLKAPLGCDHRVTAAVPER